MDNQVIFGGQINMQKNMRTVHVGIFSLIQNKKKNMLGIKTPILQHLTTWAFHATWDATFKTIVRNAGKKHSFN